MYSRWENASEALAAMDGFLSRIDAGEVPTLSELSILFAPTGSIQEVSESSGWGEEFLEVAADFDRVSEQTG